MPGSGTIIPIPSIKPITGISLASLVLLLESKVPMSNGCPEDYGTLVEDAIDRFSADAPLIRMADLSIRKGVAAYNLPVDFLFLIELMGVYSAGSTLVTDSGLIPVGDGYCERYELVEGQIVFAPTPALTMTRQLRYAAKHLLTDGVYPSLTRNGARIALIYAQHLALNEQANPASGKGWKYSFGDESVDKSMLGKGIATQAAVHLANYEKEIKLYNRHAGSTERS